MKNTLNLLFVLAIISCNNNDNPGTGNTDNPNSNPPEQPALLSYSIISPAYPHDTSSFTQGLAFYKGELFEGTGNYGKSKLMKVDLKTGKAIKSIKLDDKFFGEGITILNDTIYQLTWKENKVFEFRLRAGELQPMEKV
jgi:glutaminyl-peptide cyclotransferase